MKIEFYDPVCSDCIVRSISKALDKDTIDIENELKMIKEKYQQEKVFEKYLLRNSFEIVNTYKGKQLFDTNLIGTNIVYAKDKNWYHMMCVIDNTIFDNHTKEELDNMQIIKVYKYRS